MLLLPPDPTGCPICGRAHAPTLPHDALSLYYQYRFYEARGRWPTWADALAHCSRDVRAAWAHALRKHGAWTEPDDGEPIADPPAESIHQAVGDIQSRGFGPASDAPNEDR